MEVNNGRTAKLLRNYVEDTELWYRIANRRQWRVVGGVYRRPNGKKDCRDNKQL